MSLPNRNNPYSFTEFLERRDRFDFYRDDPFLQKLVKKYAADEWETLHEKLLEFSPKVSFRWRDLADRIAKPEVRPYIEHYDAYNNRIDRIVRPLETHVLEKEIFAEALFSEKTGSWEHFIKRFLMHQIGEAGVLCPIACTEGLIALIECYPDPSIPELEEILLHCKEGKDGEFGIGAQYMSEIQGGSDIPSNLLEAEPDGKYFRLYGTKFFTSACHADYAVVTAKVTGSEKVGTFVVPSWLPGDKEKEKRNNFTIDRIKWKMGTVELPTGEITYNGAVAYPVGPLDRGVANAVGIVLTLSRIAVGISSGAGMIRAAREAQMYSEFRDVFGRKIYQFPVAANQLQKILDAARRTTAGAFKIYDLFLRLGKKLQPGLKSDEPVEILKQRFNLRELILLQKVTTSYEAVDVIRNAISLFGGHGVIEDFTSLPRLLRDAIVNELWEGPRNVLLAQVLRDLQRASSWYPPEEFVASVLTGAPEETIKYYSANLRKFLEHPSLMKLDEDSLKVAGEWEEFCDSFLRTYQEIALEEVGKAPIVNASKFGVTG